MPSGFIALIHAAIFGLLLAGLVFSFFASRSERRPGPIFAFGLLTSFAAASIPLALLYNDAPDVETYVAAFSAHALLTRGAFIAWIFYLHSLTDFSLKWSARFMYGFEAVRALVFATHLDTPYLFEMQGIERIEGPFGDTITLAVAEPAPLHFIQILGASLHLGFALVALVAMIRIGRRRLAMSLAAPFLLVLILILVDNLGVSNIYLTELAFPVVVVALAASLMEWVIAGQRARETVVQQEAQIVHVLDSIVDGVVVCDRFWRIVRMNPVAREMLGGVPVRDSPLVDQFEFSDPETGAPPDIASLPDEPRDLLVRAGGESLLVHVTVGAVADSDARPTGYVVVMHDITERVRRERMGRRDEKMRALGELAGGVAHDFNNYLAAIGASARMLERRGDEPSSRAIVAARIGEAVAQASSLTRRLLDFSREGEPVEESLNEIVSINEVVESATELIRSMVGRRIDVVCELRAAQDLVRGSAHDLQSALLNLAKNSADAIADTGSIRIATDRASREGGSPAVSITFSDTGSGIAPEDLDRIFEPFFTTKAAGNGTGFGLPSVHRIVTGHGGTIEVTSSLGEGTTFTLLFPRLTTDDLRDEGPPPEPPTPPPGGVAHPP